MCRLQEGLSVRLQLATQRVVRLAAQMLHIVHKLDYALAHPNEIHQRQPRVHLLASFEQARIAVVRKLTDALHHARALLLDSLTVSGCRLAPV